MTYQFSGTPNSIMDSCLAHLREAGSTDPDGQAYLRLALAELVGLHHLGALAGGIDTERLRAFRRDSLAWLLGMAERVSFYLNETLIQAEDANNDEWPSLCMSRSVIQCLLDDYVGTPIPSLFQADDLADLDETLRRVGEQQGPLPADQRIHGLPASHWWWRYPEPHPTSTQPLKHVVTQLLAPALSFSQLRQRMETAGWHLAEASSQPILPDEPEFASFVRNPGEVAVYTFNPVCHLRLLEGLVADLLPQASRDDVAVWLRDADLRVLLRGLLAARHLPDHDLLAQVVALQTHPHPTLAQAATDAAAAMRADLAAAPESEAAQELNARDQALAAIAVLEQQLTPVLRALAQDRSGHLAAALVPRESDYAMAFAPEAVEAARQGYARLWSQTPELAPVHPDSRLELHFAPAGMLEYANELSWHFPGGYRAIAHMLDPHRVWVAWKLIPPGQSAGMAYDGLVWLDDHWAWFPKPYRMLAEAPPA